MYVFIESNDGKIIELSISARNTISVREKISIVTYRL